MERGRRGGYAASSGAAAASEARPPLPSPSERQGDEDDLDGDDDDDGDWEAWGDVEPAPTRCLFSDRVFDSAAECLDHAASDYGLDVPAIISALRLDLYGYVRLVNYIRHAVGAGRPAPPGPALADDDSSDDGFGDESDEEPTPKSAASNGPAGLAPVGTSGAASGSPSVAESAKAVVLGLHAAIEAGSRPWEHERFYTPVLLEDPLLYSMPPPRVGTGAGDEEGSCEEVEGSLERGGSIEAAENLRATVETMRAEMAAVIGGLDVDTEGSEEGGEGGRGDDRGYFESYGSPRIHEAMLRDEVRTNGYREAVEGNAPIFAGKVVLDVGCGTGILSLFAARAGAKLVIGVDASSIVDCAREIVAANGLSDRIKLVRGRVEEVTWPVESTRST